MADGIRQASADNYLFTWNPDRRKREPFPPEKLLELVRAFETKGVAQDSWTCKASKSVRPGCRAYMLKQGKSRGIFGRGMVVSERTLRSKPRNDRRSWVWEVQIRFDASRGDVLWPPGPSGENFLVNEAKLLRLPAPKKLWRPQASGQNKLSFAVAREIDSMIDDALLLGPLSRPSTLVDAELREVVRVKRYLEQLTRPEQWEFRQRIRAAYRDRCAVSGCCIPDVLQAAHIVQKRIGGQVVDDNSAANGILLRADIHALFDKFLITLSEDGTRIEVSPEVMGDPVYQSLQEAQVTRPEGAVAPSAVNIRNHRERFRKRLKRSSNRSE